uniref:Protein-L-isoaspartate O-methyltransferase n=1 Tax=candidate division WOR-3 bacterium TaxID=2052148 RepID=A0A7C4U8Q7_UNCW3
MKKEINFEILRKKMVEEQIVQRGIKDSSVINAMLKVERHLFVPEEYKPYAYEDTPLPIGYGQTISQPYIVALMTELLNLKKEDKVLEIGTGSGYQAAILSLLADSVFTIEIVEGLAKSAEVRLKKLGYKNVFVKCGDGYKGWKEHSPYDKIIVTCAPEEIPQELLKQLKINGIMVLPVGDIYQELKVVKKTEKGIITEDIIPVRFVPMIKGE